ncbi:MAG TPA: RNA polymerase factor sigma-54 [Planctomycetota bacterium]|nr:RNA polymerase factor sigma-54 [Planctomycetota bacterium]
MALRMEMGLQQKLELRMTLAPQIIQSIEILQLPLLVLEQRIRQELVENPVLEELDEMRQGPAGEVITTDSDVTPQAQKATNDLMNLDRMGHDYPEGARPAVVHGEKDKKHEAMQNTAARAMSLQDFLFNQFNLLDITPEQRLISENIIYNIDDSGYLQSSIEEVAAASNAPKPEEVEAVLALVQTLDPPGVGARDLRECLLLQLSDADAHPLEKQLIENHLEDIHMNRFPKIMKETSRSAEQIRDAIHYIRTHLNPRPGNLFGDETPQYIIPDIMVEQNAMGEYEVRVEDGQLPQLYISPLYQKMLADASTPENAKEFIKRKIQGARWLIEAIEQRRGTLKGIAQEIVKIQREFFERGITELRPLKMRTIAESTGVHVSTVSRAIADKYVQTPRGIFPLKYFFTGGTRNFEGTMTSRKSVKQLLLDVVSGEDRNNPLSDGGIAGKLRSQGIDIARRTVTKYRKALKIPSSRRRKSYLPT